MAQHIEPDMLLFDSVMVATGMSSGPVGRVTGLTELPSADKECISARPVFIVTEKLRDEFRCIFSTSANYTNRPNG